jgi:hypothetical protein
MGSILLYMFIFIFFLPSPLNTKKSDSEFFIDFMKLPDNIKVYEMARSAYILLTIFLIIWHIIF